MSGFREETRHLRQPEPYDHGVAVVQFTRSGVNGRLIVAADHFDLDAKLGFLLGAFSRTIEAEIEKNLDELLAKGGKAAAKKAAPKKK